MPAPSDEAARQWRLVPYIGRTGRCPVRDWLNKTLKNRDKASYVRFLEYYAPVVEDHGPGVTYPIWDNLGDGLGEIRWNCKGGKCRIYCSIEPNHQIVMLHATIKTWPKFTQKDRRKCLNRRTDFLSDDYDQCRREQLYRERRKDEANGSI